MHVQYFRANNDLTRHPGDASIHIFPSVLGDGERFYLRNCRPPSNDRRPPAASIAIARCVRPEILDVHGSILTVSAVSNRRIYIQQAATRDPGKDLMREGVGGYTLATYRYRPGVFARKFFFGVPFAEGRARHPTFFHTGSFLQGNGRSSARLKKRATYRLMTQYRPGRKHGGGTSETS